MEAPNEAVRAIGHQEVVSHHLALPLLVSLVIRQLRAVVSHRLVLGGFRSGSNVAVALVLKGPLGPRLHLVNFLVNVLNVLLQNVLLVFVLNRLQKVGVSVAAVSHL